MHKTTGYGLQYGGTAYDGGITKVHARNMELITAELARQATAAGLVPLTGFKWFPYTWDGGMERWAEHNLALIEQQILTIQAKVTSPTPFSLKTNFRATDGGNNRIMTENIKAIDAELSRLAAVIAGPLQELTTLNALRQANEDIVFSWAGRPEVTTFYIENVDVTTDEVVKTATGDGRSFLFTKAEQIAMYGFSASFAKFRVCEYLVPGAVKGPFAEWYQEVQNAP